MQATIHVQAFHTKFDFCVRTVHWMTYHSGHAFETSLLGVQDQQQAGRRGTLRILFTDTIYSPKLQRLDLARLRQALRYSRSQLERLASDSPAISPCT